MKLKYISGIFAVVALALTSCKKNFLELYPEGSQHDKKFYTSTEDFRQAVIGAYVPLRDIANNAFWMDEMRSDNSHYDYNPQDRGSQQNEDLVNFLDDASNTIVLNRYQSAYNGIGRTNAILTRIEKINFSMNQEDKRQIIGEAKALRGHYYFDLVRNFGDVPLYLQEVENAEDAYRPRDPKEKVYAQIISDLSDALQLLPAPDNVSAGRVNKGSVATELAAVYLQRKEYEKAIPLLHDVTKMGYTLLPVFKDIFSPANKNNKELIFDVQYQSGTTGQQSFFIYRFIPVTKKTKVILGVEFNNTAGGWNVPSDTLINLFEPGDTRLDASIGVIEGSLDKDQSFVPEKVVSSANYTKPKDVVAKWFVTKYYYPPYPNINQNTDQNWPLYRYADVLLMLAECLNETGKPVEALPFLNQIRARAFGDGKGQIIATGQSALRTVIANERRRELAFENKRWQDLIRTGQAISVMTDYGKKTRDKFKYLLPQSYNVNNDRLLYPIPQIEIDLHKGLTQNPGY